MAREQVPIQSSDRCAMRSISITVIGVSIITASYINPVALGRPHLAFGVSFACYHFLRIAFVFLLPAFVLGWLVCRWCADRLKKSRNLRFRNQLAERTRLTRDLNDSLLQTIEASKMIADDALDPPADPAQMRRTMSRLSDWLEQATKLGQQALDSLRPPASEESSMIARPLSLRTRKLTSRLLFNRKKRR